MKPFLLLRSPACRLASLACLFGAIGLAPALAAAGEWPQILGPDRNGIAQDERIAERWPVRRAQGGPADGPPVKWQREVGSGLAGMAVAGGKALLFHRIGDEELAEAMDPSTGQVIWTARFPTRYVPTYTADDGPRCVPLIHGGRVYLYGARRGLHCVRLDDGKVLWSRDLFKDYVSAAEEGFFGAGSSPLVEGGKLLVNLGGGRAGAGIVALDLDTGNTIWKATGEEASYSSPIAATIGGRRQAIFVTRYHVVSIDPKTGDVLWRIRFGARGPTVNAANPLVLDGHVFVSASYGVGALYADVRQAQPKTVWKSDDVMSSQYTTCVRSNGLLYGVDGRHDVPPAALRCIEPSQGRVIWSEDNYGKASLILADGKLIILKTDGQLLLARATDAGYRPLATAQVLSSDTHALPALAGGLLYVRDQRALKCLDLSGKSE